MCRFVSIIAGCWLASSLGAQEGGAELRYREQRQQLVEQVLRAGGIRDARVLESVQKTPRHEFVPEAVRDQAYLDRALPIGDQQTISSPFIVALMTEILKTKATDKVLEIGTGSGYQAAILSPLVASVYTIEIVDELQTRTTALLQRLGYGNIFTRVGDGYQGWSEHAPYDKIIVTCSPDKIPQPLIDQLREGGLMVIPVGERYQQMLRCYRKVGQQLVNEYSRPTQFVPMIGLAEARREDKVDGSRPRIINGDFEAEARESFIPSWYYDFGVKLGRDASAPRGPQVAAFASGKAGQPSMLLQGMPLDGRLVSKVLLSGWVTTRDVRLSQNWEEQPFIVLQFLDENRNHIGYHWLGPFVGDLPWRRYEREVPIPPENREAIVKIGLFGAIGAASFDGIELSVLAARSPAAP